MTGNRHHIVVIGGGFGGLNAVKTLQEHDVDITLVDKRNYHLFWPLHQDGNGRPLARRHCRALRSIFKRRECARSWPKRRTSTPTSSVRFASGEEVGYDSLIVAAISGITTSATTPGSVPPSTCKAWIKPSPSAAASSPPMSAPSRKATRP